MSKLTAEEQKEKRHLYYLKNKEKFIAKAKNWKQKNPEKAKASVRKAVQKKRQYTTPEYKKDLHLKHRYGISLSECTSIYYKQQGQCKICKTPITIFNTGDGVNIVNVDHDHTTGEVRGLLCGNCNKALGLFKDNATILRLAAEYLDEYNFNCGINGRIH